MIELNHQMALRQASLRAQWIPRDHREEADSLTNSDYRHFSMAKRIPVCLEEMPFGMLHGMLARGKDYLAEVAAAREAKKSMHKALRKKLKGETLCMKQHWG